jgi:hypothetical protein
MPKTIKPTMNIKDWEKEFDWTMMNGEEHSFDETWHYLDKFIKDLLSQSNQEIVKEILDRVDKEVIGEDESGWCDCMGGWHGVESETQKDRNGLRTEQRQKLTQLRQSNNLLGEKK